MHLLLIEDNFDLSANICEFFESRGHSVDRTRDGIRGFNLAASEHYDAILLDLGVPDFDGIALCRKLRQTSQSNVPVVMLAERNSEADKLLGFEVGADDYLTKPFSLHELLARLTALMRRSKGPYGILKVEDLTFDLRALMVQRGERQINLTPMGLRILEQLMRASPAVVTREQIETNIWRNAPPTSDAALRGHILAIRTVVDTSADSKLIHTVHGVGYRLASSRPAHVGLNATSRVPQSASRDPRGAHGG
jgi:DNA-binding response OmpR family regulator